MKLTLGQTAKKTGLSKPTISRHIKKGKLSAEPQEDGSYLIDLSEITRVYNILAEEPKQERITPNITPEVTHSNPEKDIEIAVLRAELTAAKEKIDDLKDIADEIRTDRDNWRTQATRLLNAPPKDQNIRKSIWDRLRGK